MVKYWKFTGEKYWSAHITDDGRGSNKLVGVDSPCEIGDINWADWRTYLGTWVEQSKDHVAEGNNSIKFSLLVPPELHDQSQHCKIWSLTQFWDIQFRTDNFAFYHYRLFIPTDFHVNNFRLITQWAEPYEPRPDIPTVSLVFHGADKHLCVFVKAGYTPEGISRHYKTKYTDKTIPKGKWLDVVIYMKMASAFKVDDGIFKLWIDGELLVDVVNMPNHGQNDSNYAWSIGNYGGAGEDYGQVIYFDDITVASTFEEATGGGIPTPTPTVNPEVLVIGGLTSFALFMYLLSRGFKI